MYFRYLNIFSRFSLLLTVVLASMSAQAATISPAVTIDETFDAVSGSGQYTVNNNSAPDIYAFAVGNDAAISASGQAGGFGGLLGLGNAEAWDAAVIKRSDWIAGTSVFGNNYASTTNSWTVPDTTTLPWDTLFSGFNQIVAYWVVDDGVQITDISGTTSTPIATGTSASHFSFQSQFAASPFATFGQGGTVTASGNTQVVPVPAAVWLFGSGLLGLVSIGRRR